MPSFVPTTDAQRAAMLRSIGVTSVDDLFKDIPGGLHKPDLDVPPGLSELEVLRHLRTLSEQNVDLDHHPSFLGAGAYSHYAPTIVDSLILRS